ncbi:HNH endonuclease [Oceanicoccus sagamiensis]|uniref:HNH endonuclease n=1 Tax=Oceanicoccus sagamiensis TaxID=716816 RepID=A0A1X9N8Q0_9GAMM|nr:HNH endonuclease [Oceanicoccus sagamiensis]ARN73464.1 HNH endonuclease [Oceanicoccus sagamiensis]
MQILRLNKAGHPIDWLHWQEAVCLISRELVCWSMGDIIFNIHGGYNRVTDKRSVIELPSIIACGGEKLARVKNKPPLSNRALFERDNNQCMYCGHFFSAKELTRDHIIPSSRGGRDVWENVVAACRRCNQHKGNRKLHETRLELYALPYRPNPAEYLALVNSRRILPEQADFLSKQFSANCRWQMPAAAH